MEIATRAQKEHYDKHALIETYEELPREDQVELKNVETLY
jgi:hypothetical protein